MTRAQDTVNPEQRGTKVAFWYELTVAPGETAELRLRLRPKGGTPAAPAALAADFERVITQRQAEADEFYAELTPAGASADEALVMRQALAGMLWSKQLYYYDVARWLAGDPTQPPPPESRLQGTQCPLAQLRRLRHHVHARQVGVPVVRGLGPGLPLRGPGPRGSGLRQVPTDPAVPGMVPESQRGAPCLRVGLRRRQPARAGVGGPSGLRR